MFDHVTIRVSDRAEAERFYTTVLPTLGIEVSRPATATTARPGRWIDHLWLRTQDPAAIRRFYEAVGFRVRMHGDDHVQIVGDTGSFSYVAGTPSQNVHLAFPAREDADVDAFHRAATAAGHRDNGAPGERGEYHPGYYAAFVLDPDGHNIEVVNHNR